ncbi:hypothetical protein GLAREA_12442 [Glarea lozoyensis ATCC 20868]|uniref:Uncharacterized protein n=1 Tax=Glarea lozoyensis (strain ATCC 20868 / MF5171) TaxID=1116229 RepID=S3DI21_GLAL2|nr:uncharacterized protein GLAREA_12442 [Glarea lozoyensis ATCC 20868]EPE31686.1 hypothetical protein GLAREA_12442 [Glarea lozoyensis ATCC 20868]
MVFSATTNKVRWTSRELKHFEDLDDIETRWSGIDIPVVDPLRMLTLMQGLKSIATQQMDVTNAQIEFREKRRKASFQREVVSNCDAKFMKVLQKLVVSGCRQEGDIVENLQGLVAECQAARDELGPLEQDVIEAELRWEGQTWSLRQAETFVYQHFETEFQKAALYPPASQSTDFSEESSHSEFPNGDMEYQESKHASLLSKSNESGAIPDHTKAWSDGSGDFPNSNSINQKSSSRNRVAGYECYTHFPGEDGAQGPLESTDSLSCVQEQSGEKGEIAADAPFLERSQHRGDLYHSLLTDFASKRDRINKWIQNNVLESRLEATSVFTTLKDKLAMEKLDIPSNWAQLGEAFFSDSSIPETSPWSDLGTKALLYSRSLGNEVIQVRSWVTREILLIRQSNF